LEQAAKRHKLASIELQKALAEMKQGLTVPPDGPLGVRKAYLAESAAIHEHVRILRIFVDLTVYRKIPPEEQMAFGTPPK
jgi:hypothetical protein